MYITKQKNGYWLVLNSSTLEVQSSWKKMEDAMDCAYRLNKAFLRFKRNVGIPKKDRTPPPDSM